MVQECFCTPVQTDLQVPPFKWDKSQPYSMFVAGDVIQTILGTFFWDTLYASAFSEICLKYTGDRLQIRVVRAEKSLSELLSEWVNETSSFYTLTLSLTLFCKINNFAIGKIGFWTIKSGQTKPYLLFLLDHNGQTQDYRPVWGQSSVRFRRNQIGIKLPITFPYFRFEIFD